MEEVFRTQKKVVDEVFDFLGNNDLYHLIIMVKNQNPIKIKKSASNDEHKHSFFVHNLKIYYNYKSERTYSVSLENTEGNIFYEKKRDGNTIEVSI